MIYLSYFVLVDALVFILVNDWCALSAFFGTCPYVFGQILVIFTP